VAAEIPIPILLYNLPQFTNGFEPASVLELIDSVPNIVGIKDSSGSLDVLRTLTGRGHEGVCRIIGNDQALVEAVQSGWCDGVISGVAGVLPELTVSVFRKPECHRQRLNELIDQLNNWPTPWGLKLIGEFRRMAEARLPFPLSPARKAEAANFAQWFSGWWAA
jgi:4-hydroxy-tetrahydrodipicolinate synthase